jgi:hypothetical protein
LLFDHSTVGSFDFRRVGSNSRELVDGKLTADGCNLHPFNQKSDFDISGISEAARESFQTLLKQKMGNFAVTSLFKFGQGALRNSALVA